MHQFANLRLKITALKLICIFATFLSLNSVSAQSGQALLLDGNSSYIAFSDTESLDYTNGFTISAWVYPVCSSNVAIVGKQHCEDYGYYLGLREQSLLWSYNDERYCNNPNTLISDDSITIAPDWYHLTVVHTDTAIFMYLDGKPISAHFRDGMISTIRNTRQPLVIGAYKFLNRTYGSFFAGLLDDVRIWQTALTPMEVRAAMRSDFLIRSDKLVLNLDMEGQPLGELTTLFNRLPGGSLMKGYSQGQGTPQLVSLSNSTITYEDLVKSIQCNN